MEKKAEIELRIKALFTQTELNNVIDHKAHYKWEIGDYVYNTLRSDLILNNPDVSTLEIFSIYGYPVEINKRYPNMIKLWKEVEL